MAAEIDDSELCGLISARLRDRQDKANEIAKLSYELEHATLQLQTCTALLAELRKKSYWQNNMEFVKMIDERMPNVRIQS